MREGWPIGKQIDRDPQPRSLGGTSIAGKAFAEELERLMLRLNLTWEDMGSPEEVGRSAASLVTEEANGKRWGT